MDSWSLQKRIPKALGLSTVANLVIYLDGKAQALRAVYLTPKRSCQVELIPLTKIWLQGGGTSEASTALISIHLSSILANRLVPNGTIENPTAPSASGRAFGPYDRR